MAETREGARHWVRAAVALATLGLLAVFARSVDWSRAWATMSTADASFVAAAVAANLASIIIKAVRWHLFLGAIGVRSMSLAVRSTLAGGALNNVIVANGGDAARVAAASREARVSSADVFATLAVDKLCDLASYALIFVAVAFAVTVPLELARWRLPILAGIAGVAVATVALMRRTQRRRDEPKSDGRGESLTTRARAYGHRLIATVQAVATAPRLGVAILLAFAAWAGQWATFHLAARAAAFPASATTSLLALLAVNASFLIRLTPGNVGVFQLLYALAATAAGLNRDDAVAVAFLISLIQYIPVTSIGLVMASSLIRRGDSDTPAREVTRTDIPRMRTGGNTERAT